MSKKQSLSTVLAISELREEFKNVAKHYLDYKMKMERLLADNPNKISEFRRKINKFSKFIDSTFDDL